MTGPEHHREAERLIEFARKASINRRPDPTRLPVGRDPDPPDYREFYNNESSDRKVRNLLADAQVHATLALAAATACRGRNDDEAWNDTDGTELGDLQSGLQATGHP